MKMIANTQRHPHTTGLTVPGHRALRYTGLAAILAVSLFATACDSVVSADDDDEPGLEVVNADFSSTSPIIRIDFNAPLVESTVERGNFRILSSFDNGRRGSFTPERATYIGGASNTVELKLWGDNGVGNGEHALVVTGVEDVDGRNNEVKYSFTYRVSVKTPKSFIVRKIVVTEFPTHDSVGNDWDDLSNGADIRVSFQRPNATPIFVSSAYDNANPNGTYTFGEAASFDDPGIPFEAETDKDWILNLIDEDFGGDEMMVAADVNFLGLYRLNNAVDDELTVSLRRPRFTAVIHGDWTY